MGVWGISGKRRAMCARWMARRPGASPRAADNRLRAVGWFRGWDVERGGARRPRVLANRTPRA